VRVRNTAGNLHRFSPTHSQTNERTDSRAGGATRAGDPPRLTVVDDGRRGRSVSVIRSPYGQISLAGRIEPGDPAGDGASPDSDP